jgi:hypothetical protein
MLDTRPQASLATAPAQIMWAWAFAAARIADACAARGLAFWSPLLRRGIDRPLWPLVPGLWPPSFALWPLATPAEPPARSPAPEMPAEPAFASYRSPGGHAAAQVRPPQ